MKIHDLFDKEINRHINPAVVVGDSKDEVIRQEIDEYVFTRDIIRELYRMLDTVINGREGKTGIWINGYYGSGKSHFLKYVHYCLHPSYKDAAFTRLEEGVGKDQGLGEVTTSNIRALKASLDKLQVDAILFNIDEVSGDAANERLTRIFLNRFNRFRGFNAVNIPLALLVEKPLQKAGVFEAFKKKLAEKNLPWEKDAASVIGLSMSQVLQVVKEVLPDADTDAVREILRRPAEYHISVADTLIPELREYMVAKGPDYRLLFLVDEVSQYIGRDKSMLLNLQTIVESISNELSNKVWVACTAQQNLSDVVEGMDSADHRDEFGKILGRFDTKISLESVDSIFITQHRVLGKSSEGEKAVTDLYRKNKDAIDHQFNLGNNVYRGFASEEDFALSYPFVPYQFKLLGDVLDSFQQKHYVVSEVKDNARSVLGLTHFTIKQCAEEPVGSFIPFDAFMNGQLRSNMQSIADRALRGPLDLPWVKAELFAGRVVRALFMVSNLKSSVQQTFPPTVENLAVLMMKRLDENKLELQKNIGEVLSKLKDDNMIREEDGRFFFYNEDEIEITNSIRSHTLTLEDKYTKLHNDFFTPILGVKSKQSIGDAAFAIKYKVEDKDIFATGDIAVRIDVLDNTPLEDKKLHTDADCLLIGVNEWFFADRPLVQDFEWYCRTNGFVTFERPRAAGERLRALDTFAQRNAKLRDSITDRIRRNFPATRFVSGQRILSPTEVTGSTPETRYSDVLEKHIRGVYKYLDMAQGYALNETAVRAAAADTQIPMPTLTSAEQQVQDRITAKGDRCSVEDLVQTFEKKPFGWKAPQILHMLVALHKKKKRDFEYHNEPRYPLKDFIEKAISTRERARCIVCSTEEISAHEMQAAIDAFRHVFNFQLESTSDPLALEQNIKSHIEEQGKTLQGDIRQYSAYPFVQSLQQYADLLERLNAIRMPRALFSALVIDKEGAQAVHDGAKAVQLFANQSLGDWEKLRMISTGLVDALSLLDDADQQKAAEIQRYLTEVRPEMNFRVHRKAADELRKKVDALIEAHRQTVAERYNAIFDELERTTNEWGLDKLTALPDRGTKLNEVSRCTTLSSLHLLEGKAAGYRSVILEGLVRQRNEKEAAAARASGKTNVVVSEPHTYYISGVTSAIKTPEELEVFLQKLKTDMLALLQQNKTIIIKE